jgi:hypothetical protein
LDAAAALPQPASSTFDWAAEATQFNRASPPSTDAPATDVARVKQIQDLTTSEPGSIGMNLTTNDASCSMRDDDAPVHLIAEAGGTR